MSTNADTSRSYGQQGATWTRGRELDDIRRNPSLQSSDGTVGITPGPTGTDLSALDVVPIGLKVTVSGSNWVISFALANLPYGIGYYSGGNSATVAIGLKTFDVVIQIAKRDTPNSLTNQIRMMTTDSTAVNYLDATSSGRWDRGMYLPMATITGAADGTYTIAYKNDNAGYAAWARIATLHKESCAWEMFTPGGPYALMLRPTIITTWVNGSQTGGFPTSTINLTTGDLGSAGRKYIGIDVSTQAYGLCASTDQVLWEFYWDGRANMLNIIAHNGGTIPRTPAADAYTGTFVDNALRTVTVSQGLITGIA